MRYHGTRGSISANSEVMDVEDRFDVLVDANDQLLERVVSSILDCLCFYGPIACTLLRPSCDYYYTGGFGFVCV